MRVGYLFILAAVMVGCASQKPQTMFGRNEEPIPGIAAALAFDPPIIMNEPMLDLSRNTRGEAAFAGFEDTSTTYVYVRTDDRQTTDGTDRFVREGFSERVGTTHR